MCATGGRGIERNNTPVCLGCWSVQDTRKACGGANSAPINGGRHDALSLSLFLLYSTPHTTTFFPTSNHQAYTHTLGMVYPPCHTNTPLSEGTLTCSPLLRRHTSVFVWYGLSLRAAPVFLHVCVFAAHKRARRRKVFGPLPAEGEGREGFSVGGSLSLGTFPSYILKAHTHTHHITHVRVCACVCVCCFFPVLCCPTTHTHLNRVGCSVFVGHQRHPLVLRSVPSFPRRVPGARELTHPVGYIYTRRRVFFV